jgi:hypothetical protein
MKKFGILVTLLLCCTLAFSQFVYLSGSSLPADGPLGQPVVSYAITSSNDITVELENGAMTPALFQAVANGTILPKMEITTYSPSGKVDGKVTLTGVMGTSASIDGTNIRVTFYCDRIKFK